ncbi:Response regulator receiver domain-containing protein [Geoalkalibacter ferrihydriticus]|uniref:Chemotaxis protein CheY n=2 Tax=Geoalkalibacter ferrihydriticus TaxID=392333 RepID=A0A0C2HRX9_9BACT|nr:response regulator [Geoalkalibacter ferrihydriticus]KIH75522.1 chemotaxis protein CheY [Geoalkalibacter ferrihydriticus DSM 17813]SDM88583.1 Response regulator receiver domain-containing protein [Geoalkalibacter ferrihydriticus]
MIGEPIVILLAEDDPAHAEIVRRNMENSRISNRLEHVVDGQEALDYLYRRGRFSDPGCAPRPGLILLDLRMPRINGLEVLKIIKEDPGLGRIPVVVLTTSAAETDVAKAYDHHANSYLVKPVDFHQFVEMMSTIGYYWLVWNKNPNA